MSPSAQPHTQNNFDLLRLLFAALVAIYHLVALSSPAGPAGAPAWAALGAEIGVQGFFVISGYLVWTSLVRSESLARFAEKRVRRLVPGYVVVVSACTIGALIASPAARSDLAAVGRYLGANLVFLNFLEPRLPGVFADNPVAEVNGALWTLKIEVMFYALLPLLAFILRKAGGWRWVLLALIYLGAEAWRLGLAQPAQGWNRPILTELARQLPGQMSFFVVGIAFAAWGKGIRWWLVAPIGLALLAASILWPLAAPVRALGLGILVIWAALAWRRLINVTRFGDLSYGLYIVHFPIIQTFVALGLFRMSFAAGAAAAAAAAFVAALLLWTLVERPALRSDSAYRAAPRAA